MVLQYSTTAFSTVESEWIDGAVWGDKHKETEGWDMGHLYGIIMAFA